MVADVPETDSDLLPESFELHPRRPDPSRSGRAKSGERRIIEEVVWGRNIEILNGPGTIPMQSESAHLAVVDDF